MCGWPYFSKSVLAPLFHHRLVVSCAFNPTKTFQDYRYSSPIFINKIFKNPPLPTIFHHLPSHPIDLPFAAPIFGIFTFQRLPWMPPLVLPAPPHAVDHLKLAQAAPLGSMPGANAIETLPTFNQNDMCVWKEKNESGNTSRIFLI